MAAARTGGEGLAQGDGEPKVASLSGRYLPCPPPLQAVRIMEVVLQRYGSYEAFERLSGGSRLSRSRIWHQVKKYMEKEGCQGQVGEPPPARSDGLALHGGGGRRRHHRQLRTSEVRQSCSISAFVTFQLGGHV